MVEILEPATTSCPDCLETMVWGCLALILGIILYLASDYFAENVRSIISSRSETARGNTRLPADLSLSNGPGAVRLGPHKCTNCDVRYMGRSSLMLAAEKAWGQGHGVVTLLPGHFPGIMDLVLEAPLLLTAAVPGTVFLGGLAVELKGKQNAAGGKDNPFYLVMDGISLEGVEGLPTLQLPFTTSLTHTCILRNCVLTRGRGEQPCVTLSHPPLNLSDIPLRAPASQLILENVKLWDAPVDTRGPRAAEPAGESEAFISLQAPYQIQFSHVDAKQAKSQTLLQVGSRLGQGSLAAEHSQFVDSGWFMINTRLMDMHDVDFYLQRSTSGKRPTPLFVFQQVQPEVVFLDRVSFRLPEGHAWLEDGGEGPTNVTVRASHICSLPQPPPSFDKRRLPVDLHGRQVLLNNWELRLE